MATYDPVLTPVPVAGKAVPYTWFTKLRDSIIATRQYSPTITAAPSANQNNYSPIGWTTCRILMLSPTLAIDITGFAAVSGARILLQNVGAGGAFNITLKANSASSSAGNKIITPGLVDFVINYCDGVEIWYDDTNTCWRLVAA